MQYKPREALIEYCYEFSTYVKQGEKFTADCNQIGFQNGGHYPLTINNALLVYPAEYDTAGSVKTVLLGNIVWLPGNWLEIDRTQYQVNFDNRDFIPNPGISFPAKLIVIRKIFKYPNDLVGYKNSLIAK